MTITELLALIKQIRSNEKGVTAMEYGVIAAATIVAISATMVLIGPKLTKVFSNVNTALGT